MLFEAQPIGSVNATMIPDKTLRLPDLTSYMYF